MLTVNYINYYLDAMKCYKSGYNGWITYYATINHNGYTFLDACWFTFVFILFLIFPIILDLLLIPLYLITYIITKFIGK